MSFPHPQPTLSFGCIDAKIHLNLGAISSSLLVVIMLTRQQRSSLGEEMVQIDVLSLLILHSLAITLCPGSSGLLFFYLNLVYIPFFLYLFYQRTVLATLSKPYILFMTN